MTRTPIIRPVLRLLGSLALAASLALAGCGKGNSPDPEPAGTTAPNASASDGSTAPQPAPTATGATDAGEDPCVSECLHRNMARAVSADIIRKDCERECSAKK